jgi:hypothetical protein
MPIVVKLNADILEGQIAILQCNLQLAGILDTNCQSLVPMFDLEEKFTQDQLGIIEKLLSYDYDFSPLIAHNEQIIDEIDKLAPLDILKKYYDPVAHINHYRKDYSSEASEEAIKEDLRLKAGLITTADLIRRAYTLGAEEGGQQQGIKRQQAEHDAVRTYSTSSPELQKIISTKPWGLLSGFFKPPTPGIDLERQWLLHQWLDKILEYRSKLSLALSTAQQIQTNFKDWDSIKKNPVRAVTFLANFCEMLKVFSKGLAEEMTAEKQFKALNDCGKSSKKAEVINEPSLLLIINFQLQIIIMEQEMLESCFTALKSQINLQALKLLNIDLDDPSFNFIKELNRGLRNELLVVKCLEQNNNSPSDKLDRLNKIYNYQILAREKILSLSEKLFAVYAVHPDPIIKENAVNWQKNFTQQSAKIDNLLRLLKSSAMGDEDKSIQVNEMLENYLPLLESIKISATCYLPESGQESSYSQQNFS